MLKLTLVSLALVLTMCTAQMTGNFRSSDVNDNVLEIANWATSKMSQFTGIEGVHTIVNVREVKTQVVAGLNYLLTIDYSIQGPDNKITVNKLFKIYA